MKKIIYTALLLSPLLVQAQVLDQHVIGTAGNYSESGIASLSWTIGETAVETVSDGTNTLTHHSSSFRSHTHAFFLAHEGQDNNDGKGNHHKRSQNK